MVGIERWFLRVALGVSAVSWLALVLAEFGRFRADLLLALVATGAVGLALLAYAFATAPTSPRSGRRTLKPVLEFGALLLLCALLFVPPYEAVVAGGDATVYVNFGSRIVATGALEFEDELVSRLPADARAGLFENRRPFDATGRYARFPGGFLIPDIVNPTVTAGFSPLFPVLTALFHEVASLRGALFVAPLFATLSIGSLFLVAAHLAGRWAGWLTAALTLATLPQLWFAKLPVPEMVAQYFVMTGLLAWLVSRRDHARRWAVAAGWFLGLACFAKVDLIVLLSISLLAFGAWRLLVRPERGAVGIGCLLVSFGLLLLHNGAHYLAFDSHYRPYVEHLIRTSYLSTLFRQAGQAGTVAVPVAAGLFAVGLAWVMCRYPPRIRRRACGLALAGVLAAYAVNYGATTTARFDETVVWLSWYLSWPVLILAALGLAWSFGAGLPGRGPGDHGSALALVLLAVVGLHYLYDPLESGVHIWSMRRFVPVVFPLLMLVVSTAVAAVVGRIAFGYRRIVAVGLAAALVGFVVRPSLAVVKKPLWDGALAQTAAMARTFPAESVVLMSPDLAGTHVPTSLGYLHDLDTVLIQGGQDGGRRSASIANAIHSWLATERPVFFVFSERDFFSFFAPEFSLAESGDTQIDLLVLEQTRSKAPQAAVRPSIRLRVFQVLRSGTDREAINIGDPTDDVFFGLEGFHVAERDDQGDGTFRWSRGRASLTIPGNVDVTLTVAGGRPTRAPPAEISVWMSGRLVLERRLLSDEPQVIVLGVPAASGLTRLTIESTVFQPRALDISADARELGMKLYRVALGSRAPHER